MNMKKVTILQNAVKCLANSGIEIFSTIGREDLLMRCGETPDAHIYMDITEIDSHKTEMHKARRNRLISLLLKNGIIRRSEREPVKFRVLKLVL
jgi:hypothetical protein